MLWLPQIRPATAELLARLQHADTAAAATQQIDELFTHKQREFIEAEGFVSPDEGFKALLHELIWTVTFSSAAGVAAPSVTDAAAVKEANERATAFSAANRALVLDALQRNLDISAVLTAPSLAQIALVDVMWLIYIELDQLKPTAAAAAVGAVDETGAARERFVAFVNGLLGLQRKVPSADPSAGDSMHHLLSRRALKETFPADLLESLGVFGTVALAKSMVATRTAAWYRQQKFNLLREETEGFSKLFTELVTFFTLAAPQSSVALMQRKVFSFIGFFDLDPNRVIDLLIDAFEKACSSSTGQLGNFLALIDGFRGEHVLQMLGFKFRNYYDHALQASTTAASTGTRAAGSIGAAPQSLYDVAAILIKTGRITLEGLYSHLSPSDEAMALARSDLLAEEKRRQAKQNVVSLKKEADEAPPAKKGPAPAPALPAGSVARNDASIIVSGGMDEKKEEISLVLAGTPIGALQTLVSDTVTPVAPVAAVATPAAAAAVPMGPPMTKSGIRVVPGAKEAAPVPAVKVEAVAAAAAAAVPVVEMKPVNVAQPPNQKFLLIASLLQQNAFLPAERLLNHLQSVNPCANAYVGMALAEFTSRMLRPLYVPVSAEHRRFAPRPSLAAQPAAQPGAAPEPALLSPVADFTHSVKTLPACDDPMSPFFAWVLLTDAEVEQQFSGTHAPPAETYYSALPALLRVLKRLGVYLCNDALLWSRLCRVVSFLVRGEVRRRGPVGPVSAPGVLHPFHLDVQLERMLSDLLIPAFSLMPSAHGHSEEVWSILRQLPFELRYRLYGHWRSSTYDSLPELQQVKASVLYRAKYFRKRIAAARVKECSRLILKFGENNPLLVFELLLQQLQSFDNMIAPVCDLIKLLHPLAFDALAFVLLAQLSSSGRDKLSEDGVNETHWFQSLSTFAGTLLKKYTEVDLAPLLLYVLAQLKQGQSHDLLLLKDIFVAMSNVEIHEDVSEMEMEGRAGAAVLRAETTTVRDKVKNKEKPARILINSLKEYKIALPLAVAIGQQKEFVAYRYESEHVKLISELYDKTHESFLHLTALMEQYVPDDTVYAAQFVSIEALVRDYHLRPSDAFHLLRRVLGQQSMQAGGLQPREDEEGGEDTTAGMEVDAGETESKVASPADAKFAPLLRAVRSFHPPLVWQSLTPSFYALFWRLSLSHLHVPSRTYDSQIAKLRSLMPALENVTTSQGIAKTDVQKRAGVVEKARLERVIKELTAEHEVQKKRVEKVVAELHEQKGAWFDGVTAPAQSMHTFISVCVLPRVLQSGIDAHYTAQFVSTLLQLNTRHFFYLDFLDQLFKCVSPLISSASTNEASRFGRFLLEILAPLHKIAFDKDAFAAAVKAAPHCFASKLADADSPPVPFQTLQREILKWHLYLSRCMDRCLSSATANGPTATAAAASVVPASKMEQANALLVLCKIGSEFPRTQSQGQKIEKHLDAIIGNEENKNSAIKLMATRSHAQLQALKKTWVNNASNNSNATAAAKPAAPAAAAPAKPAAPADKDAGAAGGAAAQKATKAESTVNAPSTAANNNAAKKLAASLHKRDERKEGGGGGGGTPQLQQPPSGTRAVSTPSNDSGRNGKRGRSRERDEPLLRQSSEGSTQGSDRKGGEAASSKAASTATPSKLNAQAREFTPSPAKPAADRERGAGREQATGTSTAPKDSQQSQQQSQQQQQQQQQGGKRGGQGGGNDARRDDKARDDRPVRDDKPAAARGGLPPRDDRERGGNAGRADARDVRDTGRDAVRDVGRDTAATGDKPRGDIRDARAERDPKREQLQHQQSLRDDRRGGDDRRDERRGDDSRGRASPAPSSGSGSHSRSHSRSRDPAPRNDHVRGDGGRGGGRQGQQPRDVRDVRDAPRDAPRDNQRDSPRDAPRELPRGGDPRGGDAGRDRGRDGGAAAAAAGAQVGKRKRDDDREPREEKPKQQQQQQQQQQGGGRGGDDRNDGQGNKRARHDGGGGGGGGGGGRHHGGGGGGGHGGGRRRH